MGRGWWVHVLNVEALNMVHKCYSKVPLFQEDGTRRCERAGHPHERFTLGSGVRSSCESPLAWSFPEGGVGVLFGESSRQWNGRCCFCRCQRESGRNDA